MLMPPGKQSILENRNNKKLIKNLKQRKLTARERVDDHAQSSPSYAIFQLNHGHSISSLSEQYVVNHYNLPYFSYICKV